ncbi:uncharacterized protein SPSC_04400 [Sporisorium scitamineum]|uniref:CCHC-type domain-containing protein n=1 Tax=Sporisorium scitamineum TaxID=49012 RepID=A0A0F7RYA1_9BASI|nr:uncharacterized protein SPSC_04400 [Sporisorium scitamineum]CDR99587.1 hypothetical protein [Sporisorium scitamineum]
MPPKRVEPIDQDAGVTPTIDDLALFEPIEEPDERSFDVQLHAEHIWTNRTVANHIVAPFEELPLPSCDRARLDPCSVRFEFIGPFKNADRSKAEWSILTQLKTFFRRFNVDNAGPGISFPTVVGRGNFVDITVAPLHLDRLAKAPISFNKHRLEKVLVGPKLPVSTIILEIIDIPRQLDANSAAQTVAFKLHSRDIGTVWDIWKVTILLGENLSDSAGRRQYSLVAVLVPKTLSGGKISATTKLNIPGYVSINGNHCLVKCNGRPDWCGRCKSDAEHFHPFGQCQRLECFECKERGHTADQCPKKQAQETADTAPVERPPKQPTLSS